MYDDGPAPLGLRYQINSSSLTFEKKPWFEIPEHSASQKRAQMRQRVHQYQRMELFNELVRDENLMSLGNYRERKATAEKERQEAEAKAAAEAEAKKAGKKTFNIKGVPIKSPSA